jgi:flagellar biosynthesis chaperone FliJ
LPHQILQKLSERERQRAGQELAALSRERREIMRRMEEAESRLEALARQREHTIRLGARAGMLALMDEMMREHQTRIELLHARLDRVHEQEQAVLRHWLALDGREKALDRMDARLQGARKRKLENRKQREADDRAAAHSAAMHTGWER